jgi:hypothetical protein
MIDLKTRFGKYQGLGRFGNLQVFQQRPQVSSARFKRQLCFARIHAACKIRSKIVRIIVPDSRWGWGRRRAGRGSCPRRLNTQKRIAGNGKQKYQNSDNQLSARTLE